MSATIVQLGEYLPPRQQRSPRRKRHLYELYPLPFFNRRSANGNPSTWDVKPTGDYAVDWETGRQYALEFLRTCDGTIGWGMLLSSIVADMIRAGPDGAFADGYPKINGIGGPASMEGS